MSNYFISKDNKSGEIVYLEYENSGYKVTPKAKKKDAINVNKIVFVSPELTKKLLKKKIDRRLSKFLLELNTYYDDDEDNDGARLRDKLLEAERFKLNIINQYGKYLGKNYTGLTLKKMELIVDGFRKRLFEIRDKKQKQMFMEMLCRANMESSEKKGKGR